MASESYIIRGGVQGFDRLKVLARVMHPTTAALFERVGVGAGMRCLDVGCGTGDVSFELSRRVGMDGHVVGVDLDEVKLGLARRDAEAQGLTNVELVSGDATELAFEAPFDLVYSRYVLTHLVEPARALAAWTRLVKPGGLVVFEDMDASAGLCAPPSAAYSRILELYSAAVEARGADPYIGPKLPAMLAAADVTALRVNVVQPAGVVGEVKLLYPITLVTIREAVLESELATAAELDAIEAELMALAQDGHTLMGMPRTVQAWGRRAG